MTALVWLLVTLACNASEGCYVVGQIECPSLQKCLDVQRAMSQPPPDFATDLVWHQYYITSNARFVTKQ